MRRCVLLLLVLASFSSFAATKRWIPRIAAAGGGSTVGLFGSDAKTMTTSGVATTNTIASVPAGALLVLTGANETDSTFTTDPPTITSNPALTWTVRTNVSAANSGNCAISTAVFAAGGTIFVTNTQAAGKHCSSVLYAFTNQNASLSGVTNGGTALNAPNRSITTTRANSILVVVSSDWNAVVGTVTYRSITGSADLDNNPATAGTIYRGLHYHYAAGAATAYNVGFSAPTGTLCGQCVYEIWGP